MEFLNCPILPDQFQLVLAKVPESKINLYNPFVFSKHFPKRDVDSLSLRRVVEHHVVIGATTEILGHSNWYYEHDSGGRPVLFENGDQSDKRVSISHMQCPEGSSYAAVILAQVDHNIGVDIVYTDDDRLDRIATRTMSENEIKNGRLPEIWAIKEAVFKAYGPGVDFKNDIIVKTPIENSKANVRFKDKEKNWMVQDVNCLTLALGPF